MKIRCIECSWKFMQRSQRRRWMKTELTRTLSIALWMPLCFKGPKTWKLIGQLQWSLWPTTTPNQLAQTHQSPVWSPAKEPLLLPCSGRQLWYLATLKPHTHSWASSTGVQSIRLLLRRDSQLKQDKAKLTLRNPNSCPVIYPIWQQSPLQ